MTLARFAFFSLLMMQAGKAHAEVPSVVVDIAPLHSLAAQVMGHSAPLPY